MSILSCFPFPKFRVNQKDALELIEEALSHGYEYSIVEGPCGFGKTPPSYAAALYYNPSYILTTEKVLQRQFMTEHGHAGDIAVIKGRGNYMCGHGPYTCDKGECIIGKCPDATKCEYNQAKEHALSSKIILTNYVYCLFMKRFSEEFEPRKLMVCDECHSIEGTIMNFINVKMRSDRLRQFGLPPDIPDYEKGEDYVDWMNKILSEIPLLVNVNDSKIKEIQEDWSRTQIKKRDEIEGLKWQNQQLESIEKKIERFIESSDDVMWIPDLQRDINGETNDSKVLNFKPIDVSTFADRVLLNHAKQKVMFSATILNKNMFCKSLGIDPSKAHFVRVPSTFARKNRRLHLVESGSMKYSEEAASLPQYMKDVDKILDLFSEEKGMIYTNKYAISKYIMDNAGLEHRWRLITHTSKNREDILEEFKLSPDPLVLVTASLGQGVSLDDDLARFQIITKIPYANTQDPQVKARADMDRWWYNCDACTRLEQIAGRCVRSKDDHCEIFLMDSRFYSFIVKQNHDVLHDYFVNAVVPGRLDLERVCVDEDSRLQLLAKREECYK